MRLEDLFNNGVLTVAKKPRSNNLDLKTLGDKKLVIIPIDHDYPGGSALMHNAVFEQLGLPYKTVFVVGNPEHTELIINTFRNDDRYIGGGMGSGFKNKAPQYMDELDDSAKVLGSINVVQKKDGRLIGYNTDGLGFVKGLLSEYPNSVYNKKILILGAGGTTAPIAYELGRQNPKEIVILNRTVANAETIAKIVLNSDYKHIRVGGEDLIGKELSDADLVINTSKKGEHPNEMYTAFGPMTKDYISDMAIAFENLKNLPKTAIVADILLEDDPMTLKVARAAGYMTHNGRGMNLYQAIPAIRLMTGINVDNYTLEKIMRDANVSKG
jgi:shikimate dehydrogenase